jgi:hypothetical protein
MAYDKKKIFEQAKEISLEQGCSILKNKFKNEKEFTENLLPKLESIIKTAYGLNIDKVELEKQFKLNEYGFFSIYADIYITTKQGKDILIECKNPKQDKAETFNAFGQIMSYQYLLSKTPFKPIIILATSNFEFYYFDFIKQFNLDFDVIINNKEQTAFWLNEFKNGL